MNRSETIRRALALLAGVSLCMTGCGSSPREQATDVRSIAHRSDGVAPESDLPSDSTAIAGPDGKELPGATIDLGDRRKQIAALADRMIELGREPSEEEARAYMVVYGATDVRNEGGDLVGYWVGRFHTPAEYEALLGEARAIVAKAERQR